MATIIDVAQLAGVSIKTVSRVVNREGSIRPETMEKVSRAIEMLGYEPHHGARLMRSGKSGQIGFITGLFSDAEVGSTRAGLSELHILRGAQQACRQARKTLLVADMGGDQNTVEALLKTFTSYRVEGVIYAASYHQQVVLPKPKDTPLVLVNCFDRLGTPAVLPDDALGQTRVVDHLVACGHRRIGYVGIDEDMVAGRLRKAAFMATCARHGLAVEDCPVRIGSKLESGGPFLPLQAALRSLVALEPRVTALCFGNDVMALHGARLLDELGVRVPQDMALMGFDDDHTICEAMRPQLSTVALPYFEMGIAAVERLLSTGAAPSEPWQLVAGGIVERDSTPRLPHSTAAATHRPALSATIP
nr:LacI family DNA-binding transcriptional regulator [uncultured Albidiferax sp.]